MKKRVLYFTKPCKPFNSGETAGFNDRDAERILALGVAVERKEEKEEEKKPPKKAAKKTVRKPAKKAAKK